MRGWFAAPFVALAVLAPSLAAQPAASTVRGRLVLPDSVTPAASVVIEAVRDGSERTSSRTLARRDGSFELRLAAGRWRVRALRVGFMPVDLGAHTVDGAPLELGRTVLLGGPFLLSRLAVDSSRTCGRVDESGGLVATLLDQARAALASTILSAPDTTAASEWRWFEMHTDLRGTPLTPLRVIESSSATDRPFLAVSGQRLASDGYRWERRDHFWYNAPDAEVLLSEAFIRGHCFRLSGVSAEHADRIGVAFAPTEDAGRRGVADLLGTLWFDRESGELRRLDFAYVGLPAKVEAAGARGAVDFLRLPDDVWVVSGWELRIPKITMRHVQTPYERGIIEDAVNVVRITGGEVVTVRRGDTELARRWGQPAERFPDVAARVGETPACAASAPPGTGMLFGAVTDSVGQPVTTAVVADWQRMALPASRISQAVVVEAEDGFFAVCGVPLGRTVRVYAYDRARGSSDVTMARVTREVPWAGLQVVIRGESAP